MYKMFSLGKKIYFYEADGNETSIYKVIPKTRSKVIICKIRAFLISQNGNYITLGNRRFFVFDGTVVSMEIQNNIHINNFNYIHGKYFIFGFYLNSEYCVFVNEIKTGQNIIIGKLSFDDCRNPIIQQSPDKKQILLSIMRNESKPLFTHYIIPTEEFINLLSTRLNQNLLEKYKIHLQSPFALQWLTNVILINIRTSCQFPAIFSSIGKKMCEMHIYNIDTKYSFHVPEFAIHDRFSIVPYFINGLFYLFLKDEILMFGDKVNKIPNYHKIVDYNYELDLFVNVDYDVYIQPKIGDFVKFKFVGDYYRDRTLMPHNILCISECLLYCGFVYDIMNEIYCQLLKLDSRTNVVY